ncbi:alpha/beta fold hydrolase [Lysinibacillus sp. NPDC048646]|uniref:alpha/beta fold hydrolase n=1 Tax=Lysinibacillus sp. NPDC048646 TaxID=3390574 RepID=UPI003D03F6CE
MALYYQEHGDKNASMMILFLHGGGVSGWMWDKQIQYFTDYHCVVADLPEQGLSKHEPNFSILDSAEKLIDLIEEKAPGKQVVVIGFSLGAQIAIQMLSIKANLIDFAIINSALVRPSPYAKKIISPTIKWTFPLIKNKAFSKIQARMLYIEHDHFQRYYKESCQMKVETLIRIIEENLSFEIPERFNQAQTKILITVGEKEKAMMRKSAIDLVKSNPNCQGVILAKIGHGVSLAKPDFFNRMIEGWVNDGNIPEGKIID